MLISPSNIRMYSLLKNITLNFETPSKQYGNLIFVATDKYDDYGPTFTSNLFKPVQLFSVYTPRIVKPLNRKTIHYVQKDVYDDIAKKTNNFLRIGRILPTAYAGRNLVYNLVPEISDTLEAIKSIHKNATLIVNTMLKDYTLDTISAKISEFNYEKNYLVVPVCQFVDNFARNASVENIGDPLPMYLQIARLLKNYTVGKTDLDKLKGIERIFFYNPAAKAIVTIDPNDPELEKKALFVWTNIRRLNDFNGHIDNLDDAEDADKTVPTITGELSASDQEDNTKAKITNVVLSHVSKELKTDLNDYDAANQDEKKLITNIDDKVDTYLNNKDNLEKPFDDLVKTVEQDKDVKLNAINYVQTKKIAKKQMDQLQKGLQKENEVIDSIADLKTDVSDIIEPEPIAADVKNVPDEAKKSTLNAFDREYNDNFMTKDIIAVLTSFSDQNYLPITLDSYTTTDTSDSLTLKYTLAVKYKVSDGSNLSFTLDIPKIINNHYVKIRGTQYVIQKQLTNLPIIKNDKDSVVITTNFNKIICTRTGTKAYRQNYVLKKILKDFSGRGVQVTYGKNAMANSKYSNEFGYDELSDMFSKITSPAYEINFNREDVEKQASIMEIPDDFLKRQLTPVGFDGIDPDNQRLLYLDNSTGELSEIIPGKTPVIQKLASSLPVFIIKNILGKDPNDEVKAGTAFMYSKCKFVATDYPILFLCALYEGMTSVLKKAQIKYRLSITRQSYQAGWIEVPFANRYMYYEDKIQNTMLLNALNEIDTENYRYEDFDTSLPYVDYYANILGNVGKYVGKTVANNLSKLIDPITRSILNSLHKPNDPVGLLILASNMLSDNSFILEGDLSNFRLRGNEIVADKLYDILSNAYMDYQRKRGNGSSRAKLEINPNAMMSSFVMELDNVHTNNSLNPILENEMSYSTSAKGFKGINMKRAYGNELRVFNPSMRGILSANDTPFSGSAGISRTLTYDPKITSVRGFFADPETTPTNDYTNKLSTTELLSFGSSAHADPPRIAMVAGQSKQIMPIANPTRALIGYGMEKILPYTIGNDFCFKAKKDGVVESIDEKTHIAILKYNDDTRDAIDLEGNLLNSSNNGFFIKQKYAIAFNAGEKFKAGDAVAYNTSFFSGKGNSCEYLNGSMSKIAVMAGDFVFEDATLISEKLSKHIMTNVTISKSVVLGANAEIYHIVSIGDTVKIGDSLIDFTESFQDPTTNKFITGLRKALSTDQIQQIGTQQVLSKTNGVITDMDVFYNAEPSLFSSSVKAIIDAYNAKIEAKKKLLTAKGIPLASVDIKNVGITKQPKVAQTEFPADGSPAVIIVFYVSYDDKARPGDKLTYGIALKGVISKVTPDKDAPFSEYRPSEIIDGCEASSGILSRMTLEVFSNLYANKALIELGRQIHTIWNK
jgi:hypothetical protein